MSPLKKLALVITAAAALGVAAPVAASAATGTGGGQPCVTWASPTCGVSWG